MTKIRIVVREASSEDLDAVTGLWKKLAEYHATLSDDFSLAFDSKRKWSKYLREKFSEISTKLIVAEERGRIVGFMLCMLSPNVPIYKEKKFGLISDVYVLEARRRKGVAKKMLDLAAKWFIKNKVKSLELSVAAMNLEARAAWRTLGFEPVMIKKRLNLDNYPPPERYIRVVRKRP